MNNDSDIQPVILIMVLSAFIVVIFVCVHIFANRISLLHTLPRKKWLSLSGGISIAFVFLHILPELNSMQDSLRDYNQQTPGTFTDDFLYITAMAGILLFYGLEQAIIFYGSKHSGNLKSATDKTIFWCHIGMFATFNIIIGYYLHTELRADDISSFLSLIALAFHFLLVDYSLFSHHDKKYHYPGRWIMTGAIITGWAIGVIFVIPDTISFISFALLAGAIVVNSFKEELPEEKESNYLFFFDWYRCLYRFMVFMKR